MIAPTNNKKKKSPKRGVNPIRIVVWGIIGLAIAAIALFLVKNVPDNESVADKPAKSGRIAEATPEIADPQPEVEPEKPKEPEFVMVDGRKIYRSPTNDVGRVVTNAFGKTMVIERVVTPSGPMKDGKSLVPRRIFTYDSEVAIDALLNMEIGERTLMMLPANMDQDFLNSMSSKIVIEPEDTEDEIRRKNEMIAIKAELAERVANGEKVSEIAAETLAHYNKVATMRDTLLQEIYRLEDSPDATEDDIEDIYEAANAMLKEYDAMPLHSPKVRKAIIRERLERNKARRQQNGN